MNLPLPRGARVDSVAPIPVTRGWWSIHPDGQKFGDLTLVVGPPLLEPDGGASTSTDHGYKARGLDVSLMPYHWSTRMSRPTCRGWERGASYSIGGDPRSPTSLILCLPCVTRAMDCDELRWRAMNRERVRTSLRTVA